MKKDFNKNESFGKKKFAKNGKFNDFASAKKPDFNAEKSSEFSKNLDKNGEKFTKNESLKEDIEALQYELSVVLEAMLLFAGAKRERLEDAVNAYIDVIDEVLESSTAQGVDEILEVVYYLKIHKKELFL